MQNVYTKVNYVYNMNAYMRTDMYACIYSFSFFFNQEVIACMAVPYTVLAFVRS